MSTSFLDDETNNNIVYPAVNNNNVHVLLLLPPFIDQVLSTTLDEHVTETRTAAASCL